MKRALAGLMIALAMGACGTDTAVSETSAPAEAAASLVATPAAPAAVEVATPEAPPATEAEVVTPAPVQLESTARTEAGTTMRTLPPRPKAVVKRHYPDGAGAEPVAPEPARGVSIAPLPEGPSTQQGVAELLPPTLPGPRISPEPEPAPWSPTQNFNMPTEASVAMGVGAAAMATGLVTLAASDGASTSATMWVSGVSLGVGAVGLATAGILTHVAGPEAPSTGAVSVDIGPAALSISGRF